MSEGLREGLAWMMMMMMESGVREAGFRGLGLGGFPGQKAGCLG